MKGLKVKFNSLCCWAGKPNLLRLPFTVYCLLFTILILLLTPHVSPLTAYSQETVLQAGISIDKVPKELYGTWRVSSTLVSTSNLALFKKNNVDLWNLSRSNDVITLDNPFSGAHASVMFDEIKGNYLRFRKIGSYNSQKLTDTVELKLNKDTFTGANYIKLDTISDIDGRVVKSEGATYTLRGEKISGEGIKIGE